MSDVSRGILYPARLPRFTRVEPSAEVAELVRWFWIPEWDLAPGRVSRQYVVAYPGSNLVVDSRDGGFVGFAGPTTKRSHQDLQGTGWAVGAHLQPAAVPHFTDDPGSLRDSYTRVDAPELFSAVSAHMLDDRQVELAAARLAEWILARVGPVDDEARAANSLVALIEADPTIVRLEDAATKLSRSPRTLQRLARKYVGLPPATMVRRRRLQEAAERVRTDRDADLAEIAADLGYADHAHLTNEFRTVLGMVPSEYRREN